MTIALIDNGSLEPAAPRNLRAVAAALSARTGASVDAVSWKHSDRIPAAALDARSAWTLSPFVRAAVGRGEREFVFVPFFVSAQGAIGSALRDDLEKLQREVDGFDFTFTDGLAARGALTPILVDRIRAKISDLGLIDARVIVVDHGGPSPVSATLRNAVAAEVRSVLGHEIAHLGAASMEGEAHAHNRPLFVELLTTPPFDRGDIVVAPLFLSPGRHAGPQGDLSQIAGTVRRSSTPSAARCHFADLVGTHPLAIDTLTTALRDTLSTLHVQPFA